MDVLNDHSHVENPKPTNFDDFLPRACKDFCLPTDVIVTKTFQEIYVKEALLTKRKSVSKRKPSKETGLMVPTTDSSEYDFAPNPIDHSEIDYVQATKIETVYDSHEKLVQLRFLKNKLIPRRLMQIVALTIPYQKYLTSITINSGLYMETLYELNKLLPDSNITELCLDGTYLTKPHYHILLMHSKLKHLSLARCSINDAVVKMIMDQLSGANTASGGLSALNLSTNSITDVGAKYVADMLRTNRKLSYLNLAGNLITDEGGISILDQLQKFPLESQELLQSRARYVTYMKNKKEYIEDMIKELLIAKDVKMSRKKTIKKSKLDLERQKFTVADSVTDNVARTIKEKAENMAEIEMGLFNDHFSPTNTESLEGIVHCLGNNILCYLNFAYNNLTYVSVKKLLEVLETQKYLNRTPKGLIKVVIEGNLMPVSCKEYEEINNLFGYNNGARSYNGASKTKPGKKSP